MGKHNNMGDMYKAIEALIVIHNICIDWGDSPEDIWDFNMEDDLCHSAEDDEELEMGGEIIGGNAEVPAHETDEWLRMQGRRKQQIIMDELFPI